MDPNIKSEIIEAYQIIKREEREQEDRQLRIAQAGWRAEEKENNKVLIYSGCFCLYMVACAFCFDKSSDTTCLLLAGILMVLSLFFWFPEGGIKAIRFLITTLKEIIRFIMFAVGKTVGFLMAAFEKTVKFVERN